MKKNTLVFSACMALPMIVLGILSQTAQGNQVQMGRGFIVSDKDLGVECIGSGSGSGSGGGCHSRGVGTNTVIVEDTYFGFNTSKVRVSPSAGRKAYGMQRAILDVCNNGDSWDVCTSDCVDTCNGSSNYSCNYGKPNHIDCVASCEAAKAGGTGYCDNPGEGRTKP